MADRGPNPHLWMVTAGPRQPLKGVPYIQKFLSQNGALLAVLLRQCFPTFLGLRHPTEKNNNLRHP